MLAYRHRVVEDVASLFTAMAHPTRMRILVVLEDGEHDVGDLAGRLAVSATNVSQHLALLRRQGLVQPRRVGTRVCYSLRDRRIADLIGTALEVIDVDADQARDTRRAIRRLRGRR